MTDFLRSDLINGDTRLDIGPIGLLGMNAREKTGERPGVVTPAITLGVGILLGKAAEHEKVVLHRPQRGKNLRQFGEASFRARCPVRHVLSIRDVEESHSIRRGAFARRAIERHLQALSPFDA